MRALLTLFLLLFSFGALAEPGRLKLGWTAPSTREDGSSLAQQEIKIYELRVYEGTDSAGDLVLLLYIPGMSTAVQLRELHTYVVTDAFFELRTVDMTDQQSTPATVTYDISTIGQGEPTPMPPSSLIMEVG